MLNFGRAPEFRDYVTSGLSVMAVASPSSGIVYTVILEGGQPWGIRLQGGYEFAQKLRVAKVSVLGEMYALIVMNAIKYKLNI